MKGIVAFCPQMKKLNLSKSRYESLSFQYYKTVILPDKYFYCRNVFFIQFLGAIKQGPRGVYPCLGMVGKTNGSFVVELNSEIDTETVLLRGGTMHNARRLNIFRSVDYLKK